jgi:hypothetical protein
MRSIEQLQGNSSAFQGYGKAAHAAGGAETETDTLTETAHAAGDAAAAAAAN